MQIEHLSQRVSNRKDLEIKILMSNERFARLVEIQLECSHKMIVKEVEDHFVPRNELFRIALRKNL